ncbi:Flp pilus assembly protein CpaB [Vibrio sp. TRT 21S02]|uniref:Flp pilus assembly protein CpaB n=1 Tax=unclassified Vibrio TaxID=2614977 RepID=UPI003CF6B54B
MKSRALIYSLLAGLGVVGWWFYSQSQAQGVPSSANSPVVNIKSEPVEHRTGTAYLLVTKRKLKRGTIVSSSDLEWQPSDNLSGDLNQFFLKGLVENDELDGFVARHDIETGKVLKKADFIKPGEHNYLSAVLRPGMRAVSIPIDVISGSSGLITPGNSVDVILSTNLEGDGMSGRELSGLIAKTVLKNVRVLAINQSVDNLSNMEAFDIKKHGTATLETSAEQAELLIVARKMGELSLSLRSEFSDYDDENQQTATLANQVLEQFKAPIDSPNMVLMHGVKRRNLSISGSGVEVIAE